MAIRKPSLSVKEARHLAAIRNVALDETVPLPSLPAGEDAMPARIGADPDSGAGATGRSPEVAESTKQVFLSAPLPARGLSKSYDFLSKQYQREKALRMVLRRALDDYEVLLDSGQFKNQPLDYASATGAEGSGTIQTSRVMTTKHLALARAFFDPLGFESDRAFGRKLACAALGAFFALEKRRP